MQGRLLRVIPVAFVLAACANPNAVKDAGVTIVTTATPSSARLGDTVRVAMVVRNVGDEAVQVIYSGCNNDFTLAQTGGVRYYPAEQVSCPLGSVAPVVLAPGESTTLQEFTTGRVLSEGSTGAPFAIPAGAYLVQPSIAVIRGDEEGVETRTSAATVTFRSS